MGKRKKFDKIERNETYYAAYGDESDNVEEKQEKPKKEKRRNFFDLNPDEVPEKKEPSVRFKYKKEKRSTVSQESEIPQDVCAPSKAPFILVLISLCLVLLANALTHSGVLSGLSFGSRTTVSALVYAGIYIVPAVIYMIINRSRVKLHNLRGFSPSMFPFIMASFGLVVFLTALQKYAIAYAFSYSNAIDYSESGILITLLMSALLPAICEELLVRGIFQYEVSIYAGGLCGIVAGAFVFAMLYFDLRYFFVYFVMGLVLGTVTHVTRSCIPSMIVHFLAKTAAVLLSEKLAFVATERIGGMLLMIILAVACFVLLVSVLQMAENISKKRAASYREMEKSGQTDITRIVLLASGEGRTVRRSFMVFTSPFILVSVALFILASVIGMNLL